MDKKTNYEIYIEYYDGNRKYLLNNEGEGDLVSEWSLKRFNITNMVEIDGFINELRKHELEAYDELGSLYDNVIYRKITKKIVFHICLETIAEAEKYEDHEEIIIDYRLNEYKYRVYSLNPDQIYEREADCYGH